MNREISYKSNVQDVQQNVIAEPPNKRRLGLLFGAISGFLWGLDAIMLDRASKYISKKDVKDILRDKIGSQIVTPAIHDTQSCIIMVIYVLCTRYNTDQTLWIYITSKSNRSIGGIALASLCGGPIGISAYSISIEQIGAGYAAAISALYPGISAFLAHVFLHDRILFIGWVGIVLCIIGSIPTSISAAFTSNESSKDSIIGILCGFICALGWGLECIIANHIFLKYKVNSDIAYCLRQIVSLIVYNCILLPSFSPVSYLVLSNSNLKYLLYTFIASISGTISYICYYHAIDILGSVQAIGLNITYVAWTSVISLFFNHDTYMAILIPCAIIIAIGSFLCSGLGKDPYPWGTIKSWFR